MGYRLGIDLGTTWTAAAVARADGTVEVVALGGRTAAIPTLVHLAADGTISVGEAAARRGVGEPFRLAREVKRRVGDTVPVLLGGSPQAPEALLAEAAGWVVATVSALEGEAPEEVCVTHPANWGPLRQELLAGALRQRGIAPFSLLSEPEAAARHYASAERVPVGTTLAVYDLGGGTFDATVLRKESDGFVVIGTPDGIDRLGGLDFDAAVLAHVTDSLGATWDALDPDDPAVQAGVARLREACVAAKEDLSVDADATIAVTLPDAVTEVRITRSEFEAMVRPAITASVVALERAVTGADLTLDVIDRVLLVGGSSRVPLVAELVGALGRPLALDTHPKHAVALGAARAAAPSAPAFASAAVPRPDDPPSPTPATYDALPSADGGPTSRRPRRTVAVAAGLLAAVVVTTVAATQLGGGDDPVDGERASSAATTTTTSGSTAADDAAPGSDLSAADLVGAYALELSAPVCSPSGAACPDFTTFLDIEVDCPTDDRCTVAIADDDAFPSPLEAAGGGRFEAVGGGNPGSVVSCADTDLATSAWTLTLVPAVDDSAGVDALSGSLHVDTAGRCDLDQLDYELTGRPGESGDEVAALAGSWTLVDDLPQCLGDGCAGRGAIAVPVAIVCAGATCTASVAGGPPQALLAGDAIGPDGALLQAFGDLPTGEGFTCGGVDAATSYVLSLAARLDGQGRLGGTLALTSVAGSACGDTSLVADVQGIPAA